MSNAFRALHVVPPSVDEVSMMRGLPPELQDRGAPVPGSAHSWNTTNCVPFAEEAADGNPFERGVMFASDDCKVATLVESTLMFPWSYAMNGVLPRIDCGLVQFPGPRRFETKIDELDPNPRQKAETSPLGDATSHVPEFWFVLWLILSVVKVAPPSVDRATKSWLWNFGPPGLPLNSVYDTYTSQPAA